MSVARILPKKFRPFFWDYPFARLSITALLDREEPKDLADIWGFCCIKGLSVRDAITNAQGKAMGVFPVDLGRVLCSVSHADWKAIRWTNMPSAENFLSQLNELGESLLLPGNTKA